MKSRLKKLLPFLIGLALILVVNAAILIRVAYNRLQPPIAVVTMTERELSIPTWDYMHNESNRLYFRLKWRGYDSLDRDHPLRPLNGTIDAEKLKELGFDLSLSPDSPEGERYYRNTQDREFIWVLEYDGKAYQEVLEEARKSYLAAKHAFDQLPDNPALKNKFEFEEENYQRELQTSSRLFVVDVGTAIQTLREKYDDPQRYLFLKGNVGLFLQRDKSSVSICGRLKELITDDINVPARWHPLLNNIAGGKPLYDGEKRSPRYQATVAVGPSLEPYLLDVQPLESSQ